MLHVEDADLEVAMATEAQADMMSDEASEGSTDNDDFCILEAPGMGIPVSATDHFMASMMISCTVVMYVLLT